MSHRGVATVVTLLAGVALGGLSVAFARAHPGYSFAGESPARAAAELAAGGALLAAGLVAWRRRPSSRFGLLLAASGLAWFLLEWNNPGIGSGLAFTFGLTLSAIAPPLVAHAALAYPRGRLSSLSEQVGLAAAYAGALVLGLLPALFLDTKAGSCGECARNLLLVRDSPRVFEQLNRVGVQAGFAWSFGLIVLLALRLARASPPLRRLIWPVLAATGVYLGLVAADFAHSRARGTLSNDPTDRALWLGEAGALVALALGVAWSWLQARRTRGAVARLVVEQSGWAAPGDLRDALARTLHDPSLQVGYPIGDGRLVDAQGRALAPSGQITPLARGGQQVALLAHRPGLLDDPALVDEVAAAARLALDNERLQAEARAQLDDLRTSRARVIAAGDAERRRLERDLHDGAQQRLVGLSLSLRLARSALGADPDPEVLARIHAADEQLRAALAELRELAQGIFPAVLADEGLAAALEVLAEDAPVTITLEVSLESRLDAGVEGAAYFLVAEIVRRQESGALAIAARRSDGRLIVEVESDARHELADAEDRLGAVDGLLEIVRTPGGGARIRAEIPCES